MTCGSFQLGNKKQLKNVGQTIEAQIKFYFEETQRTPILPITPESLGHVNIPPTFSELLSYTIFNKVYEYIITSKKSRLISPIGQNVCRAATQMETSKTCRSWHDCKAFNLDKELMTALHRFRHSKK